MILREVTVGRSKDCDIYLDPRCKYASSHHGTIYYDGNQLMFKDTSSNGTMINNIGVNHRAVPINRGDIIMLAGKYQLNWNQIDTFFPYTPPSSPKTEMRTVIDDPFRMSAPQVPQDQPAEISKWNWGAFGLYPLWGFFNGCWWGILVSVFAGWFYPIPNIIFGIYGSKWAWQNKAWTSVQEYKDTQANWSIWGIILTCANILFCAVFFLFILG